MNWSQFSAHRLGRIDAVLVGADVGDESTESRSILQPLRIAWGIRPERVPKSKCNVQLVLCFQRVP